MSYSDFLARKVTRAHAAGRNVTVADVHPMLHRWQAEIVQWAVHVGRAAVWADTGLGKTVMQLEWARLSGDTSLIVAPLAVCHQCPGGGDAPRSHGRSSGMTANLSHHRTLLPREIRNGFRYTDDGFIYGTPRAGEGDPRFDKSSVPAGAFHPNEASVWGVLDRITWFTMADAKQLLKVAAVHRGTGINWEHSVDGYQCAQAARAGGENRYADWCSITEIVRGTKLMISPPDAGRKSQHYSSATATWDQAFGLAEDAAKSFLVADRPELSDSAYEWLTSTWCAAFPASMQPERSAA